MDPSTWIVGLDLTPQCHGAMRFAAALDRHAEGERFSFVGCHVVEQSLLSPPRYPGMGSTLQRAQGVSDVAVNALHVREAIRRTRIVEGRRASETLAQLAADTHWGLVIGRQADADEWRLVALGPTARRLLRTTPTPLCVVPPDFEDLEDGPILLALDPDDACVDAARFAVAMGRRLNRDVRAVHASLALRMPVASMGTGVAVGVLPPPSEEEQARAKHDALKLVHEWLTEHDLPPMPTVIEAGLPAIAVERVARELSASMLVCGARQLSFPQRLLQSSVANDLAAQAHRPLVVVPARGDSDER